MKKLLSILVIVTFLFTGAFSTVYADNGKKHNQSKTKATYQDNAKKLKEQLKNSRKNDADKEKLLKELAKEKKKKGDNSYYIIINGTEITTDTQPVIKDGKLLLPAKPITKALGAKLEWDQKTNTITITKGDIKITLKVGSNVAIVNNTKTNLENKIELKNGGIMLPMGLIAKILKQTYEFDKDSGVVIIDEDKNPSLAFNKPSTASSTYTSQGAITFVSGNAFDGKTDTRWASQTTTPQWISVDLGQQKYIGKIKLIWDADYAKTYTIQTSNDGIAWTDVYATAAGDGNIDEIAFANSVAARYVRVLCQQGATQNGFSLREVEVFAGVQPSGSLTGSAINISGAVNLTTEGAIDWANWGYGEVGAFNHMNGVAQSISNFTRIGTAATSMVTGNPVMYSWANGTSTAIAVNSIYAVYTAGSGNGFQFTVPADTTAKTLRIYTAAWAAKGKLEVSLNDGITKSFVGYVDSPDIINCTVFTINYKALTNGQVLTVKYTVDKQFSSTAGGVSLQAAALK